MTPQEFKEGVGAYVLGALDPEEMKAFEAFLASGQADEECMQALERARVAAEGLSASLPPVKPGSHVWQAIEAEVTLAPDGAQTDGGGGSTVVPLLKQAFPWAIAASLLLVTLLTQQQIRRLDTAVGGLQERETQLTVKLTALRKDADYLMSVLDKPGTQLVSMAPAKEDMDFRAAMVMHSGDKDCLVIASSMKPLKDKYYTLWFLKDGKPTNAGVIQVDENGTGMIKLPWEHMEDHPDQMAVTIEDEPGVELPSGNPVLVGSI